MALLPDRALQILSRPLIVGIAIVCIGLPLELARFFLGSPNWILVAIYVYLYTSVPLFFLSIYLSKKSK